MKKIISVLAMLAILFSLFVTPAYAAKKNREQDTEAIAVTSKITQAIIDAGYEVIALPEDCEIKVSDAGIVPTAICGNDIKLKHEDNLQVLNLPSWSSEKTFEHTFENGAVLTAALVKENKTLYVEKWEIAGDVEIGAFIVRGKNNRYNVYAYDENPQNSDKNLFAPYDDKGKMIPISHISIVYSIGSAVVSAEPEDEPTADVTPETEATPETEVTPTPEVNSQSEVIPTSEDNPQPIQDTSISLKGIDYAYIFGYEPVIKTDGNGNETVEIKMAMDDCVTVEQVCAMLMRLLDQKGNTTGVVYPKVEETEAYEGEWFERGLLYMFSKGGFESGENVELGNITRGHVAKLVAHALDLNLSKETPFADIDDCEYKEYIEILYYYGYMTGQKYDTFNPDATLTRGEFCQLINNIIDRNEYELIALDGDGNEYEITSETYHFIDMSPTHWAYKTCLRATSSYNAEGYVDLELRAENMRNKLDNFNGQTEY